MRSYKWMAAVAVVAGAGVGAWLWLHGPEAPHVGDSQTTVAAGAAGVPVAELARRLGWNPTEPATPYDGKQQELTVYVPPATLPAKPRGLLVAVQLGAAHAPPTLRVKAILKQSNLILVSCNANGLSPPQQAQRLLDIAAQFQQRYAIDPRRIYLMQTDASHFVPFAVADMYTGFISLRKLILYEDFRTETKDGPVTSTPHDKHRPQDAMIALAKRRPFVLLMDPRADPDMTLYRTGMIAQLSRDGYEHVETIPIAPDENRYPGFTGDWFRRAIRFLDSGGLDSQDMSASKPATGA
jgi:hypothetical protein